MTTIFPQYEVCVKKWLIPVTHLSIIRRLSNNPKLRRFMTRLAILLRSALLILTLVCVSQTMARSQKYKVTIKAKEQRLLDVFKTIQKQTNLIVFYSNTILNDQEKVSIQVKDEALEKVLDQIVAGKALQYEVQEKYIVIAPKEVKSGVKEIKEGTSVEDVPAPPPPIQISGKVMDKEGNPLISASITVKGKKIGTATDNEGLFILKGVEPSDVIIVSYSGYKDQRFTVGQTTSFIIKLELDINPLDEIQVIAYGTQKKRNAVGNITTIKAADIEKQPVTNLMLALQGRVSGLEITQVTGVSNGAVNLRLQGQNSIRSLTDESAGNPLIVVDGIPIPTTVPNVGGPVALPGGQGSSTLSFINPADIESVDILKDADATAIYGSRAANGAILITTKKGKAGKMKADISFQQGFGQVPRKVAMMNRRQYLDMRYEAFRNDNRDWTLPTVAATDLKIWDTTRATDWQDVLIGGSASYTNAGVSLSGGSSTTNYLISGTYNRTTTVFPDDNDDQRGSLHFSVNGNSVNQRFKIQLSGSYLVDDNRLPSIDLTETALKLEPTAPSLYLTDGSLNWELNSSGNATWENPLHPLLRKQQYFTKNFFSNASLSYAFLKNLVVSTTMGYSDINLDYASITPLASYRPELRPSRSRSAVFTNSNQSSWIVEPQIHYNERINQLQIELLTGATIQKNESKMVRLIGSGHTNDLLLNSVSAASSLSVSNSSFSYLYNAVFGRLNLNWQKKYIFNINARRDGSSRFGKANKFANFGSIGAAWIFTEEKFFKVSSSSWFSFGKLRTSYGTTGSDHIVDYSYLSLYTPQNSGIPYQGTNGLQVNRLPNPYLQWESTRKLQIGTDLGFFNDLFVLNATYNLNRSSNQLLQFILPVITGFPSITQNFPATVKNSSWEFMVNTRIIKSKDFEWNSSFNLTIPSNKVESFPNFEESNYGSGDLGVITGQPLGIFKTYKYAGLDPATGSPWVENYQGVNTSTPSFATDRTVLISNLTKYFGGLQNQISYKGINLDLLFQFTRRLGIQDLYYSNGTTTVGRFSAGSSNQPVSVLDRWQKLGDIALAARYTTQSLTIWGAASNGAYSNKVSYIRLRNASLSWQLPDKWLRKLHLESSSIYCLGQNLWTITGYTGLDPETGSKSLPPLRMITFGVKVGL